MPRDDYEQRQEERRERYEERAEKADAEGERRVKAGSDAFYQMNGQPILVGHHSEKRHRAAIKRADNNIRKGIEAGEKARHYKSRAAGVGRAGISSDDPEALQQLAHKLEGLEAQRAAMTRINAAWRKAKKPRANLDHHRDGFDGKPGPEYEDREKWKRFADLTSDGDAARLLSDMRRDFMHRPPFSYHLSNLSGNIRRVRQRIETLRAEFERQSEPEPEPIEGDGFAIVEDHEINRLCIEFPGKPSAEVRRALKLYGFRWNRTRVAWTRQLNNAARYNATAALKAAGFKVPESQARPESLAAEKGES